MSQRWLHRYLSEEDIKKITDLVHEVELQTSGEIVPMIIKRSSAIGHVPMILALSCAVIFLGFEFLEGWHHWAIQLFVLMVLMALSWFLSGSHWVQRVLTANADEIAQVEQRAHLEFLNLRLSHPHAKTAVLIFVSVMERRAVILADEAIAKKLPPETWSKVLQNLSVHLRKNQWNEGFELAIKRCGELLTENFPPEPGNPNKISNELVIRD